MACGVCSSAFCGCGGEPRVERAAYLGRDAAVGGEDDVELNVQLALHERVLMHGHPLVVDRLDVAGLNHLAGSRVIVRLGDK